MVRQMSQRMQQMSQRRPKKASSKTTLSDQKAARNPPEA
jgi:hypothetical protein